LCVFVCWFPSLILREGPQANPVRGRGFRGRGERGGGGAGFRRGPP
jgi:hypothetical protein